MLIQVIGFETYYEIPNPEITPLTSIQETFHPNLDLNQTNRMYVIYDFRYWVKSLNNDSVQMVG
jgi:hypothetical protein